MSYTIIILIFLIFTFNISISQWEQVGFENEAIPALTTHNDNLLAGEDTLLYISTDLGITWDTLGAINSQFIEEVKNIDGILFLGTGRGVIGTPILIPSLFRSVDNGMSWDSVYSAFYGAGLFEGRANYVFASADGDLISSSDTGLNWQINISSPEPVSSIAINDTYVFVSFFYDSLYRSSDFGSSWVSIGSELPSDTKEHLVSKGDTICTLCSDSIYLSPDEGNNWINISNNFPISEFPSSLFIIDDYLFCPTIISAQIYVTQLSNIHWRNFSNGLLLSGFPYVFEMILVEDYIFINTFDGIWRRPFSEILKLDIPQTELQLQNHILYQNYPNPFNSETVISYVVHKYDRVCLSIFNVRGELITTLVDENQYPGSYSITWRGENLSSGIYYIRLSSLKNSITRKCVMIK